MIGGNTRVNADVLRISYTQGLMLRPWESMLWASSAPEFPTQDVITT